MLIAAVLGSVSPAMLRAQGESPVGQVLEVGDRAWADQRHAEALAAYEEVVRRDSTATRALFRLATLLAWRNDLDRAVRLLRQYRRLVPDDADGVVALGRTLAWDGRYDESVALYDSLLAENPRHREAALGAAQVQAWVGDLDGAISRYRHWLRSAPADAEAWAALAQAWRWSGRPGDARQALLRALEAQPGHAEATTQLRWVDAALAPSFEPALVSTNDSDRNRSTTGITELGIAAPWDARLVVGARYRAADLGTARATALTMRAASSWAPGRGAWAVRGEVGATRLAGRQEAAAPRVSRTQSLIGARLSGVIARRLSLGAGMTRSAFDETAALILSGIATTTVEGDAELALPRRLAVSSGGSVTRLDGGSIPNSRTAASGALRWTARRGVSVAAGVRTFGYERAAREGYFAPKRYLLAEGSLRLALGGELGWGLDADAGVGGQSITAFDASTASRFAQRASGGVVYRPSPAAEWRLGGSFANVASPTTISSAEYRAWSVSLRARVGL